MKKLLKRISVIRKLIGFYRRMRLAASYYNYRYKQIYHWLFTSNEDTNFTYDLTATNIAYLANFISVVTKKPYDECLAYIKEPQQNNELTNFILNKINSLPEEEKSVVDKRVEFGKRLGWYAFVRILKPKVVVETGIDKGLGGVLLCTALQRNTEEGFPGRYYGTDINPNAGYLVDGVYKQYGEILYGDSISSLEKMNFGIDIFINDSDHSADYEEKEYEMIKDKLNENSIIIGDNAHVTDRLSKFSIRNKRYFLFFNEMPENHWYPGGGIGVSFTGK